MFKCVLKKAGKIFYLKTDMTQEYFTEIAKGLRELWPAGEKDGKYPWRDSVPNLAKRLKLIWEYRDMQEYSLDLCLAAGRKYLAQFERDARYMQTLKYFIFKQGRLIGKDGRITYIYNSKFADMLEGMSDTEQKDSELISLLEGNSFGEGELI